MNRYFLLAGFGLIIGLFQVGCAVTVPVERKACFDRRGDNCFEYLGWKTQVWSPFSDDDKDRRERRTARSQRQAPPPSAPSYRSCSPSCGGSYTPTRIIMNKPANVIQTCGDSNPPQKTVVCADGSPPGTITVTYVGCDKDSLGNSYPKWGFSADCPFRLISLNQGDGKIYGLFGLSKEVNRKIAELLLELFGDGSKLTISEMQGRADAFVQKLPGIDDTLQRTAEKAIVSFLKKETDHLVLPAQVDTALARLIGLDSNLKFYGTVPDQSLPSMLIETLLRPNMERRQEASFVNWLNSLSEEPAEQEI